MYYLALIKLLYYIEREALIRWGRLITCDYLVSMPNGCALSETINLITEERPPEMNQYWSAYISAPKDWQVSLLTEPERDELSPKIIELANEIYEKYRKVDRWTLAKGTHKLPEYHDPHGSALPIEYREILIGAGKSEEEAEEIIKELHGLAIVDEYFSR